LEYNLQKPMELEMSGGPERFVTIGGECFVTELRSAQEYEGRDGVLHKFHLTDKVNKRGKRLVSVFAAGTLEVTCANFNSRLPIVCSSVIRRAFDTGALSFDALFDDQNYTELWLSTQDFQTPARTDAEIRQYIIHKAYWLAYKFPFNQDAGGILYPIPYDDPTDLDYLGVTAVEVWKNMRRLDNQGLLEKVMEGHARPSELLLSRYESGDRSALGLPPGSVSSGPNTDWKFAKLAVQEARKSSPEDGRVHPKVGVVVVKDGRVLGSAHRGEFPQCHAEFIALEKKLLDVSLSGATVYTTLEPCTVRNPPKVPCASRLADRKVARVVIGMLDPDKRVRGLGQIILRKARIVTDFFPHDLMEEVEELNRDFIRDRESRESPSPDGLAKVSVAPKLRVVLVHGHASNFLLKYTNDEDEPVFIREVGLFSGKVELTEPLVPDAPTAWTVGPHSSVAFGKNILQNRNPAASLIKMNSNKGLFFETEMDVVVEVELRGQRLEARHTLYVKVNAASNTIVPLV